MQNAERVRSKCFGTLPVKFKRETPHRLVVPTVPDG